VLSEEHVLPFSWSIMRRSTRRGRLLGIIATLAVCAVTLALPAVSPQPAAAATHLVGGDVSWPNCPKGMGIPSRRSEGQPMPLSTAKFVIIGLTNGPAFYVNPCLAAQVTWAKNRHLWTGAYSMTTYPTPYQVTRYGASGPHAHRYLWGKLWNVGYAQARYNVASLRRAGLTVPFVWVDVEDYPVRPWSGNAEWNRQVVRGALAGYRALGYRVGVYSTPTQWARVVGTFRTRLPEWRTAGGTSMGAALGKCSSGQFQGGPAVLAQWWDAHRDYDVMCAGYGTRDAMRRYFHHY
jgi:hypothetical protein